jgi:hypothetical protein
MCDAPNNTEHRVNISIVHATRGISEDNMKVHKQTYLKNYFVYLKRIQESVCLLGVNSIMGMH